MTNTHLPTDVTANLVFNTSEVAVLFGWSHRLAFSLMKVMEGHSVAERRGGDFFTSRGDLLRYARIYDFRIPGFNSPTCGSSEPDVPLESIVQ